MRLSKQKYKDPVSIVVFVDSSVRIEHFGFEYPFFPAISPHLCNTCPTTAMLVLEHYLEQVSL